MILKYSVTPAGRGLLRLGDKIGREDKSLSVSSKTDCTVSVHMDANLTLNQHTGIIQTFLTGCKVALIEDPPPMKELLPTSMTLDATDMVNIKPVGITVWDNIFKKPGPVFDLASWASSKEFAKYVYLPNCTRVEGPETEDYSSNAMYTVVMLNAYQDMCLLHKLNPSVQLKNGDTYPVLELTTLNALDNTTPGEKAAGLAHSNLVDFDDSNYGKKYLKALLDLSPERFDNEPARRTVLAKCEFIIAGKTSHLYNQAFVKGFFAYLGLESSAEAKEILQPLSKSRLYTILRGMIVDGFVLEASSNIFRSRANSSGLDDHLEFLTKAYEKVCENEE